MLYRLFTEENSNEKLIANIDTKDCLLKDDSISLDEGTFKVIERQLLYEFKNDEDIYVENQDYIDLIVRKDV